MRSWEPHCSFFFEPAKTLEAKSLNALATVAANLYRETIELKKKAANKPQRSRLGLLHGGDASANGPAHKHDTDA
ncbi:hypothetical protein [Embleya sp. NPDC059237]|uniref:hypothetical protein n=1 Tax=Embleya sp. NPDC059237 TaxID=3346784 RepID=UPI003689506C